VQPEWQTVLDSKTQNQIVMRKLLIVCIVFTTLVNCKKKTAERETPGNSDQISNCSLTASGAGLTTSINIRANEIYNPLSAVGLPKLVLSLQTVEKYGCSNYSIAVSSCMNGDQMVVRLDSINRFPLCLTSIGPANAGIALPENIKDLVLLNGNSADHYNVAVTNDKVTMTVVSQAFSNLVYPVLNRVVPNSFAYVCGTNVNNEFVYNDFAKILADSTTCTEFSYNAGYKIYSDSSSGYWRNHATRFYKFTDPSQFAKAGKLLKNYSVKNITPNAGVGIYLQSWDNQMVTSWMP
jgi:hypothetical protein